MTSYLQPIQMNMDISRSIYEGNPKNYWVALAQKIAIYTVVPIALIMIFEAIVKDVILINFINITFTVINKTSDLCSRCWPLPWLA